jgi:hypothetical protein
LRHAFHRETAEHDEDQRDAKSNGKNGKWHACIISNLAGVKQVIPGAIGCVGDVHQCTRRLRLQAVGQRTVW